MFSCCSCMRRHVRALLGDSVLHQLEQRTAVVTHHASRVIGRSYSATSRLHRNDPGDEWRKMRPEKLGRRPLPSPAAIRKELVYLLDPLKLADHVLNLLREGKFDEAQALVREASKNFPCTVSWNHLINSQLNEGKVNGAIKTYNEVCNSFLNTFYYDMPVLKIFDR
jgi:hypothetical protein